MPEEVAISIEGPRNDADAALRDVLYGGSSKFSVESVMDAPEEVGPTHRQLAPGQRRIELSWTRSRG